MVPDGMGYLSLNCLVSDAQRQRNVSSNYRLFSHQPCEFGCFVENTFVTPRAEKPIADDGVVVRSLDSLCVCVGVLFVSDYYGMMEEEKDSRPTVPEACYAMAESLGKRPCRSGHQVCSFFS